MVLPGKRTIRSIVIAAGLTAVVLGLPTALSEPANTFGTTPIPVGTPEATVVPTADTPTVAVEPVGTGPLRADGSKLIDADGREVHLSGVNWFGMETGTFAPHGLWARSLDSMLDQIVQAGFNAIRLPYTNQLFDPGSTPNGINLQLNSDLEGLTGLQIMDQVIERAGARGLKVILDRHRPTADAQSELWFTDKVSEQRWIQDWVMLAARYRGNATVIGADLHNEPHGPATWGDGNASTDWRLAAERAGNAILESNPDWLIIVEGIEHQGNDWYWWGGNLSMAEQYPVRLSEPDKLVYEAHDYGPEVNAQKWFQTPDFPNDLPSVWTQHWAYLQMDNVAPVLLGEFGGRSVGQDPEGVWQRSLVSFLRQNDISYTYWSWNPNSGDTGGILEEDWTTLDAAKLGILSAYQWPLLSEPEAAPQSIVSVYQLPTPAPTITNAVDVRPAQSFAMGGPFDPDMQHVLAGVGGPSDPDPLHRQAREEDERRYLDQVGSPWEHALYATRQGPS